jgi:hypothetical protein
MMIKEAAVLLMLVLQSRNSLYLGQVLLNSCVEAYNQAVKRKGDGQNDKKLSNIN